MKNMNLFQVVIVVILVIAVSAVFEVFAPFIKSILPSSTNLSQTPTPVTVVSTPDTTSEPAPKVTLSVAHLYEMIELCEKLITASDQYVNTATINKPGKILFIPVSDQKSFTYTGTIQVGIDLSEIQFDGNL